MLTTKAKLFECIILCSLNAKAIQRKNCTLFYIRDFIHIYHIYLAIIDFLFCIKILLSLTVMFWQNVNVFGAVFTFISSILVIVFIFKVTFVCRKKIMYWALEFSELASFIANKCPTKVKQLPV